jgi:hypothetical protein
MKEEAFMWKPSWRLFSPYFSSPARLASTGLGKGGTKQSSNTARMRSAAPAKYRPSFYASLTCLALAIASYLALEEEKTPGQEIDLRGRGWAQTEAPCPGLLPGYYEIETEEENLELYVSPQGEAFASRENLPPPPFQCRPISKPSHVKEI